VNISCRLRRDHSSAGSLTQSGMSACHAMQMLQYCGSSNSR
jgi:hypothetical protein